MRTTTTERQKMLAGELYDPLDAELVAARARARDLCRALNGTREADQGERRRIVQRAATPRSSGRQSTPRIL